MKEEMQEPMVEQEEPMVEESNLPTEQAQLSKSDKAYLSGLMKLLHSKKTAPMVEQMLQSGPPEKTVPEAALQINSQFEQEVRKKGQPPSLELLFSSAIYLVGDLIEIGNSAGFFEINDEQEMGTILQDTMKRYIQKGLKEGTIDPVELQQKVEPMLTEEDKAGGLALAQNDGIPTEPNEHTAMEVYAQKQVRKKGMLQGGKV
jgi:hypothetical protein